MDTCKHNNSKDKNSCSECMKGAPYKFCCLTVCGELMSCNNCNFNNRLSGSHFNYMKTNNMTFDEALYALRMGHNITLPSWNNERYISAQLNDDKTHILNLFDVHKTNSFNSVFDIHNMIIYIPLSYITANNWKIFK